MKKILNLGCGTWQNIPALLWKGEIYCADMNSKSIEILHKRFPETINQIWMAETLNYQQWFFDEIYAFDILEHVQDIDLVLKNINNWLKVGGTLYIEVPYDKSEIFLTRLNPEYPEQIWHMRIFSKKSIVSLLEQNSFNIKKIWYSRWIVNIYLGLLFFFKIPLSDQMSTVSWKGKLFERIIAAICIWFDKNIFNTFLKWIPLWIVTLPIGWIMTQIFPKTLYIIAKK